MDNNVEMSSRKRRVANVGGNSKRFRLRSPTMEEYMNDPEISDDGVNPNFTSQDFVPSELCTRCEISNHLVSMQKSVKWTDSECKELKYQHKSGDYEKKPFTCMQHNQTSNSMMNDDTFISKKINPSVTTQTQQFDEHQNGSIDDKETEQSHCSNTKVLHLVLDEDIKKHEYLSTSEVDAKIEPIAASTIEKDESRMTKIKPKKFRETAEEYAGNTYNIMASDISKSDLLKPGEFKRIALEVNEDFKITISSVGVTTSSKMSKPCAMSYIEMMPGERMRKFQHSVVIKSIFANTNQKETDWKEPTTYIMNGSKHCYTFMNHLASKKELVDMPDKNVTIKFEITVFPKTK